MAADKDPQEQVRWTCCISVFSPISGGPGSLCRHPEAHNNLPFALRKQGEARYDEALKHYNRAIRLDRNFAEAYLYRGVPHTEMGNSRHAEKDLKKMQKLNPEHLEL